MKSSLTGWRRPQGAAPSMVVACALALWAVACASAPPVRPSEETLRVLPEAQALDLVRTVLREGGRSVGPAFSLSLGRERLEVDVALMGTAYGVEWISSQDRANQVLPEPASDGQLRILPGTQDEQTMQILLLDERTYRYDPDRERVERGATSLADAESRLRRDVVDFLAYAQSSS